MIKHNFTELLERHKNEPHISLDEYLCLRNYELARSVSGRIPLYLDTKFWIIFRDVLLGSAHRLDADRQLLERLRILVKNGRVFCPISETTFIEINKQEDSKTRLETARLIDELSCGVAFTSLDERIKIEVHTLLLSLFGDEPHEAALPVVWTSLAYVIGKWTVNVSGYSEEENLFFQKSLIDQFWDTPMIDLARESLSSPKDISIHAKALAEKFNARKLTSSDGNRDFKKIYKTELENFVSLISDHGVEVTRKAFVAAHGHLPNVLEGADPRQNIFDLLVNVIADGSGRKQAPTVHILATCHAVFESEKNRKYDGNDLYDFHHAAAAIGYCQLLLTDNPMKRILTAASTSLHTDYGCVVASTSENGLAFINRIFPVH